MKCVLCERQVSRIEKHHLFPKPLQKEETINVCPVCHDQIHFYFSNKKLLKKINTIKSLKENMACFLSWLKSRPDVFIPIQKSKKRFII